MQKGYTRGECNGANVMVPGTLNKFRFIEL